MKQTALYTQHCQANAKLVDFFGWEMPLHYGSQIQEHQAVRQHCGVFDVSHMTLWDISGADAQAFFQQVLANDVAKLQPMQALYSTMLNEAGGILDDVIVYAKSPTHYRLVSNSATYAVVESWLSQHAQAFEVEVRWRDDLSMLAVQGPEAVKHMQVLLPHYREAIAQLAAFYSLEADDVYIGRTGYTGEDGFEMMLPHDKAQAVWQQLIQQGVQAAGLGARDSLRLEAGLLLNGQDMDVETNPLMVGLNWTIAWQPDARDFIGRQALQAYRQQGTACLVGVVLQGRGVLRHGQQVRLDGKPVGVISSGGFSPTLNQSIAFARCSVKPQTNHAEVLIRDKIQPIALVKPRFVRQGQPIIAPWCHESQ